jgi:hypothetical protein
MKWQLIILLIFLVACAKPVEQAETPEQIETPEEVKQPVAKQDMMIAEAVKLGQPIKCVSEQAGQTATIYMKGSKMRMDTSPSEAHGIYTEDTMYTWQGKQGTMMKLSDIKQMSAELGQQYQTKTQEEVVANAEQSNARCEPADVPESMFVPPSDVEFQDLGEMMKQLESMTKNMPK